MPYRTVVVGDDGGPAGDDARALARTVALDADRIVESDAVGPALHAVAQARGADLIVVGTRQTNGTGATGLAYGTRVVVHQAPCTVAVAPAGYGARPRALQRVGVAYDGSAASRAALGQAHNVACRHGARIIARDVMPFPSVSVHGTWSAPTSSEREMTRIREAIGDLEEVELSVHIGLPHSELTMFSRTVDLLFCGSRQSGTTCRVALGSTGEHLAGHAACPLFLTPSCTDCPAGDDAPELDAVA